MKKIMLGISLAMLAFGLSATVLGAGDKIDLRLNLKKGNTYNLRDVREDSVSQVIDGYRQNEINRIRLEYKFDVEDVDSDGIATVKTTYSSCAFKKDSPSEMLEYDSAKPTEVYNPTLKFLAALIGKDFVMKITPLGRVREVTGIESEVAGILEGIVQFQHSNNAFLRDVLKIMFKDQTMRETMNHLFANYPDHPVAIGDSWSGRSIVSQSSPMIFETTWTLKERRQGRAVVSVNSRILTNPEALPLEFAQFKLTQEVTGQTTGTLELNETTGWIISASMDQQWSGEVKIASDPRLPEGLIIPKTSKTSIKLESF